MKAPAWVLPALGSAFFAGLTAVLGKAGVGSAINDSTRLLGGTLGVAVIGSVHASIYGSRLGQHLPSGLPAR